MAVNMEHLARLARIALEPGDREKVEKKITQLLEHFNQLAQVDTHNVEPFFHANPEMEPREDVPEAPILREMLMKNAPDSSDGCFRLPKVVGDIE